MAAPAKLPVVEKISAWDTPRETWEYVTVPEEDPLGKEFPRVTLSGPKQEHVFLAGQTYHVPSEVAAYVKDRVKVFNRGCVRLLQPNVDTQAQRAVSMGSQAAAQIGSRAATAAELASV